MFFAKFKLTVEILKSSMYLTGKKGKIFTFSTRFAPPTHARIPPPSLKNGVPPPPSLKGTSPGDFPPSPIGTLPELYPIRRAITPGIYPRPAPHQQRASSAKILKNIFRKISKDIFRKIPQTSFEKF